MSNYRRYSVPGYELDPSPIGEGGFGLVFRAREVSDLRLERAVKVIDPSAFVDREKSFARFKKEASALSRLDHPNIVRYHGSGFTTDEPIVPYLITALVNGHAFTSVVPMNDVGRVRFMVEVLEALDYAHRLGLFHRDIKSTSPNLSKSCEA
jgi:eukaryotic-like serine/threonine-protein kinase